MKKNVLVTLFCIALSTMPPLIGVNNKSKHKDQCFSMSAEQEMSQKEVNLRAWIALVIVIGLPLCHIAKYFFGFEEK